MVLYLKHRKEWEVKIMPTREEIGRRLRECRKTKGISSEKAAIEMGLTASSLRNMRAAKERLVMKSKSQSLIIMV